MRTQREFNIGFVRERDINYLPVSREILDDLSLSNGEMFSLNGLRESVEDELAFASGVSDAEELRQFLKDVNTIWANSGSGDAESMLIHIKQRRV